MVYCQCCHSDKQASYCPPCITEGVTSHLQVAANLRAQCSSAVNRSNALVNKRPRGSIAWRQLRAQISEKENQCTKLIRIIEERQFELEKVLQRTHESRPCNVHLKLQPPAMFDLARQEKEVARRILHARRVLVSEAVSIFGIEKDGRQWTIAGISLPEADNTHSWPPADVNASLAHIIHLLSLVARYLSITLPFTPAWMFKTHVGRPIIRANIPFLSTTKYREKTVLWMSSTSSRISKDARAAQKHRVFLTSYALLCHSVAYLAWSQGIEGVGVEQGAEISPLALIQALSCSPKLGQRAHEPGTSLLNHLGFSLDVHQVVAHFLGPEDDHGWDIVEDASAMS